MATPEENFNKNLWVVLQRIKEQLMYTKYGEYAKYQIFDESPREINSNEEELLIIKLNDWGVITLENIEPEKNKTKKTFKLKIQPSKFTPLYRLYENALLEKINHQYLNKLINETLNPISNDTTLTYDAWRLSKKADTDKPRRLRDINPRVLSNIKIIYDFSPENRKRIRGFLQLIYNQMELKLVSGSSILNTDPIFISSESLKQEGYGLPEAELLVETIDKIADHSFLKLERRNNYVYNRQNNEDYRKDLKIIVYSQITIKEIIKHIDDFEKRTTKNAPYTKQELRKEKDINSLNENLPKIRYNSQAGTGQVNAKKFKLKDHQPEYRVFKLLYERINKKVLKYDILVASHFYEDGEDQDPTQKTNETNKVNDVAKTIREKTGLTTEELVNNNGNLTLLGLKLENPTN